MLRRPSNAIKKRFEAESQRKHETFVAIAALTTVIGFIVFIFLVAPNDHDEYCETEGDRSHSLPYFRPIVAKDFGGTPAETSFSRIGPYNDNWKETPYPSDVSTALCRQDVIFEGVLVNRRVSNLFWVFGQFIDHTFTLLKSSQNEPKIFERPGIFMGIHPSDFLLDKNDREQQINLLEPYMDASVTYGHTHQIASSLRGTNGKLKMIQSPVNGEYLLFVNETTNMFISGDVRVNENVLLTSMHTLWNREHNYWADKLARENPHWTSQHIYDMARHIVIGEIQAITYREWLPLLLGTRDLYGRQPCHRSDLKAEMFNEFSTAAFRLGHTLVTETLEARDLVTGNIDQQKSLTLFEAFGQVSVNGSVWKYGIDVYLYGASLQEANQLDNRIIDALRGTIFDLVAMNIARGRNHHLSSFQQLYELVTGREFTHYAQLTRSQQLQEAFEQVYGDPRYNQIDPWVAIVSEDQYGHSMLGRVGSYIVAEQFALMRDADPYFYLWDEASAYYRAQIHNTRLSDVIRRNTEISWEDLGPNVFVL